MALADFDESKTPKLGRLDKIRAMAGDDLVTLDAWLNDTSISERRIQTRLSAWAKAEGRPELTASDSTIRHWRELNGVI